MGLMPYRRFKELRYGERFHLNWDYMKTFQATKVYLAQWNILDEFPHLRRDSGEYLDRRWARDRVFLDRHYRYGAFCQSQCRGFITKTCIDQRQISNENNILRLFLETSFQFAACMSPTFLGGSMVTADFLHPAEQKTQFTRVKTQCRVRLGKYFR